MAAVGGGPVGMFAMLMIALLLVGLLFLYGSFIANKAEKSKTSLSLFSGVLQVILGIIAYFLTSIIIYNNHGKATNITGLFLNISLFFLSIGLLVTAISFVLYVKKHNKLLKILDTTNRIAP